jgi:hypothetical protein
MNAYYEHLSPQRRIHVEIEARRTAIAIGSLGKEAIELFHGEFLRLAMEYGEAFYGINPPQKDEIINHFAPEEV